MNLIPQAKICKGNLFFKYRYIEANLFPPNRLNNNGFCQVIPFKVPRKSELFQEDLYPETQADIPALTADEWWANKKNADPVMMSMADGGGSNKEQEELVITKVIFSYI